MGHEKESMRGRQKAAHSCRQLPQEAGRQARPGAAMALKTPGLKHAKNKKERSKIWCPPLKNDRFLLASSVRRWCRSPAMFSPTASRCERTRFLVDSRDRAPGWHRGEVERLDASKVSSRFPTIARTTVGLGSCPFLATRGRRRPVDCCSHYPDRS